MYFIEMSVSCLLYVHNLLNFFKAAHHFLSNKLPLLTSNYEYARFSNIDRWFCWCINHSKWVLLLIFLSLKAAEFLPFGLTDFNISEEPVWIISEKNVVVKEHNPILWFWSSMVTTQVNPKCFAGYSHSQQTILWAKSIVETPEKDVKQS